MSWMGTLLCGNAIENDVAKKALDQLGVSLNSFFERALKYLSEDMSNEATMFGPFCARVLLENSCTALVGRLDIFRMIYLCNLQSHVNYDYGRRAKSAFQWSGDVVSEDKPNQDLWGVDSDFGKVSRALFSKHVEQAYWKPAVNRMLDFVSSRPHNSAFSEVLNFDADAYIPQVKGQGTQLYSTLSKGVHWEFLVDRLVFDEGTVKSLIRETCLLVGHLGLVSHFVPSAYASLSPQAAINAYIALRK